VSLSETHADRYAFFLALLEEATGKKKTTGRPFLWGAVRNVLVEEAKRPDSEIILKLCRTTEQRVKEMMVNVLITLGQDDPEQVARILRNLLPSEKKATEFQKIRQLVGKSAEVIGSKSRNARKIAIEVASNLGISWVLQTAALQADPTIRATAVRYSYHLWKRDWEKGFQILEHLAENATHGLIPNSTAFESAMGLSAVIFFEHYEDEIVLRRLQSIWREVIATILRIREESGRGEEAVRAFIRERFFSFVITVVFGLFSELPAYGGAANYSAIEAFFHLGVPAKLLYKRLIQYIDVEGSYFREQMENDFLRVMKETNNHLIVFVVQMGLIAHACHSSQAFLPFLQKFFEEAKKDRKTYPYMNDIVHVMDNVLHRGPMDDDLFDFFVSTVEVCQEYYTQYPEAVRNRYSSAPEALNLGPYIFYYYQKTGEVGTEWFKTRIQTALLRKDTRFFDFLITSELPLIGIERKSPKAALNALTLFFKSSLNASRERDEINILQFIITFLARLRVRYPDEVDDFLEEQHASEELQLQVRTNEPTETTGELIGQRSWYFLRDEIILKSPELRSQLMHVFTRAAGCKNMKVWLNYFLREVINLIYGGEALRQTTKQVD